MKLLSIVVPSYNQGAYIRETLDSILSQDYRPIEVLVLDGGSTDETVDVLKSYDAPELRWWSERDRGVVDAVNKGLALARGDAIAIQSSDDVYVPGAFSAAMEAFDGGVGLVYGDVEYIDAQSRVSGRTNLPPFDLVQYVGKRTFIPQPAAFFTAEAMNAAGAWREDISYAADAEFYLRIAEKFPVRKIDRVVARYRYHETQRDKEAARIPRDWAKAIEPWARSSDRRLRRAARSGIELTRVRYAREGEWLRRTLWAYRALLANPLLIRDADFRATNELIPGRYPVKRALSRIKQAMRSGRRTLGALVYDWPRFTRSVLAGPWTRMHNRDEIITVEPRTGGVRCEWRFTSDLHIVSIHPRTAARLLHRATAQWPVEWAERQPVGGEPRVSFIVGHRGEARLPLLLKTLATIAAQRDVAVECIVVEQAEVPLLETILPPWVRHVFTPSSTPYNRSAAFNTGARAARAPLLVLHDNDMLAPAAYASELVKRHTEEFKFIDLKRFIFYLPEDGDEPDRVMQNAHGGSIAADAAAYRDIGGFDESFVGWGGEDLDFWWRAETRRTWSFGYLPFIHLWHAPQAEKEAAEATGGRKRLIELEGVSAAERIARLRAQNGAK